MSAPRLTIGLVRRGHSETGGAEAYLKRLARGLSESGHATRLFTDAAWPAREWPWGPITRLRGETARRFADELEKAGPRNALRFSLESRAGLALRCLSRRRRHSPGVDAPARRGFGASPPTLDRFNAKHRETLELERALFTGGARRVIANSQMVKREAEEFYGYPASQIDVVPNGVPLADFRPDPEVRRLRRKILRLRDDEVAVLFVGSGWERKGVRFAARAVNSLGKNFRLLVAGRGRSRMARGRHVQRLGVVRDLLRLLRRGRYFPLADPLRSFLQCLPRSARRRPAGHHHARQRLQRNHRERRPRLDRRRPFGQRARFARRCNIGRIPIDGARPARRFSSAPVTSIFRSMSSAPSPSSIRC